MGEHSEQLELCPFCKHAYALIEQVRDGDWRVTCYGCKISTFETATKYDAIQIWREHTHNQKIEA